MYLSYTLNELFLSNPYSMSKYSVFVIFFGIPRFVYIHLTPLSSLEALLINLVWLLVPTSIIFFQLGPGTAVGRYCVAKAQKEQVFKIYYSLSICQRMSSTNANILCSRFQTKKSFDSISTKIVFMLNQSA